MESRMTRPVQVIPVLAALAGLFAIAFAAYPHGGPGLPMAVAGGALAGIALQRAAFGFAWEWKSLVGDGRTLGLRVQVLLIAALGVVVMTLLALSGGQYRGALAAIGLPVVLGAFLFGIGMQVAGACASGSLFSAGGGNVRGAVTVLGFIVGATIAAATYDSWSAWPALPTVSLTHELGLAGALAAHLAICSVVYLVAAAYERGRTGRLAGLLSDRKDGFSWRSDRWPLAYGAIGLGVACIAILLATGRPWALISAYPLIGSKVAMAAGAEPDFWGHWAANPDVLTTSLFADAATMTDAGVLLGALLAAALAGGFSLRGAWPLGPLVLSLLGGTIMGFGARLAVGCNIGAFLSGSASGSMHGWVFLLFALAGTASAVGAVALARRGLAAVRRDRAATDDSWKAARA
jgi:hypothetical protein